MTVVPRGVAPQRHYGHAALALALALWAPVSDALHAGPLLVDEPGRAVVLYPATQALRAPNFADLADLEKKILALIDEWNEIAHPFAWTAKSFEKVLNRIDDPWDRRPHWSDVIKAPPFKAAA